jgi:hypothetical protein
MQKLLINTIHHKCNESRNDLTLFTDYYSNDCHLDFVNNFFGCLPFSSNLRVGFEKDLKTIKYKLSSIKEIDSKEKDDSFENEFKKMKIHIIAFIFIFL